MERSCTRLGQLIAQTARETEMYDNIFPMCTHRSDQLYPNFSKVGHAHAQSRDRNIARTRNTADPVETNGCIIYVNISANLLKGCCLGSARLLVVKQWSKPTSKTVVRSEQCGSPSCSQGCCTVEVLHQNQLCRRVIGQPSSQHQGSPSSFGIQKGGATLARSRTRSSDPRAPRI